MRMYRATIVLNLIACFTCCSIVPASVRRELLSLRNLALASGILAHLQDSTCNFEKSEGKMSESFISFVSLRGFFFVCFHTFPNRDSFSHYFVMIIVTWQKGE